MRHSIAPLIVQVLTLVLLSFGNCEAQDFLDENPEFKRLYLETTREMSEKEREDLLKYLSALPPEERRKFMAHAVEMGRRQITVEQVYAKYSPASRPDQSLSVIPFPPDKQPITEEEIRLLEQMNLKGELRIEGFGTYSSKGARGPTIRVLLIMQRQVDSPVEFPLPPEGRLILLQTDSGWLLEPSDYRKTEKTVRIEPSNTAPHRTSVNFDTGNGRSGSDAFGWR
ncbi:MAG: hypothetical protein EHM61_17105 [Acidobacteria bacterium]|nr:MAG: hypothetical protein EHM61_17105 [Acidobacteriota bacterium]